MTPWIDTYLSPQAQAAMIAGFFLAAGWWVVAFQNRWRDRQQRQEKINDIQRALLAEIRAHVVALEMQPEPGDFVAQEISDQDYLPILPHDANDRIFRAIVEEVHILPEWTIDPVVRYYRLLAVRAALAQDIRNNLSKHPRRTAEMFRDYLMLNEETLDTGLEALEILTASLKGGRRAVTAVITRHETEKAEALNMRSADRKDP